MDQTHIEEGNGKPPQLNFPRNMEAQQKEKRERRYGISCSVGNASSGSGAGRDPEVVIQRNPCAPMSIGTWNVRTMGQKGKLENVKREMDRYGLSVLGLSEVRWKGEGDFESDGVRVIYSGGSESQRGVAILLDKETAKRVISMKQCSDRLMMVKVRARPMDLVIIKVYMPTTDHDEEEVDKLYEEMDQILEEQSGKDNVVILGDWNAVVGEGQDEKEVGKFGLGKRNDRGEKLVEFCRQKKLMITNTWFNHVKRRRYTWKKPGDTGRYQIDYILVRQRYRNGVKDSRSYPGADVYSDHNLVAMKVDVKLKKMLRGKRRRKWNVDPLKTKQSALQKDIEKRLKPIVNGSVEERWSELKDAVINSATDKIGFKGKHMARKPWITKEMISKMEERREWKRINTAAGKTRYKQLNNELRRETDKAKEEWWGRECHELEEL